MDDLEIGRTLLLFAWAFGLAGIEIEIEGGHGWAERLPTWFLKRGVVGRVYGAAMGHRPLTGYHVFAFTIPVIVLHFPFVMGVEWSLAGELRTFATFFAVAVVWDYLWFVLNPAYTVRRFRRGAVWWFEVPWIWRFPLDYYSGFALSVVLAALAAWAADDWSPLTGQLWMLLWLVVLVAVVVVLAPLYHRWYRHMRRAGADDRSLTTMYPPPDPGAVWSGGTPELPPLAAGLDERRAR
jgi:hypothetical protein